jgi:hypothetical protein
MYSYCSRCNTHPAGLFRTLVKARETVRYSHAAARHSEPVTHCETAGKTTLAIAAIFEIEPIIQRLYKILRRRTTTQARNCRKCFATNIEGAAYIKIVVAFKSYSKRHEAKMSSICLVCRELRHVGERSGKRLNFENPVRQTPGSNAVGWASR